MRYVIFSDIHGNGFSFQKFLEDIQELEYDEIVFLGDFVGYYYDSESIIAHCINNGIKCLLGNHDSYFLRMLDGDLDINDLVAKYGSSYAHAKNNITDKSIRFLRNLRPFFYENVPAFGAILFCHGSPIDYVEGRIYPDTPLDNFEPYVEGFRYVICGHTHHKMVRQLGTTTFLNPGSLGQQRDGKGCSYVVFDTDTNAYSFRTVNYDIDALESLVDSFDRGSERLKKVLRRTP